MARKLAWPALGALVVVLGGCADASLLQTILGSQASGVLGQVAKQTVVVEVVNQTANDVQLDLTVDGQPLTITCTAVKQVCPQALTTCPTKVEAVQQRSLDSSGQFVGGRNFKGNEAFIFSDGEFNCDSTLVYKFTETEASTFAL